MFAFFQGTGMKLFHQYRLHIWLREIRIDELLLILALALFALLTR
jgi:hypothetical protein